MGRIADYVATLSPAEREQFKDLIEECAQRESAIQAGAARAEQALVQLAEQQQQLAATIRGLERAGQQLLASVSRVYLRTVPPPARMH
jgi:mitochondrial fission protein ELM1